MAQSPRLHGDLAWVWPFVSPPEDYVEEVESFRRRFADRGVTCGARVLHLGCVNPEVEYLPGDIRSVRLGRTFDAVLLHDASAYMTSQEQLLQAYETAAAHLEIGGVMVTPPEELRSRFVQHRSSIHTRTIGDLTVTTVEMDYDPNPSDSSFEKTFIFAIREGKSLRVEWDVSDLPADEEFPLVTAVRITSPPTLE